MSRATLRQRILDFFWPVLPEIFLMRKGRQDGKGLDRASRPRYLGVDYRRPLHSLPSCRVWVPLDLPRTHSSNGVGSLRIGMNSPSQYR